MHGQCDARPTVTFPAAGHHRPLTATKLYCLVCEQLAQGCYLKVERPEVEHATFLASCQHPDHYITGPATLDGRHSIAKLCISSAALRILSA